MKLEIQKYILECRKYQLKKLIRVKTLQYIVLPDTPDTTFDKVSMDILDGTALNRKRTLVYTHYIRFAYQIFSGGAVQASNLIGDN